MLGLHVFQSSNITPGRCGAVINRPSPGHLICCGKPIVSPVHAGDLGTFDRYDNFYTAIALVREVLPQTSQTLTENPAGCALSTRVINRLREAAQAEVPYGATVPNKDWRGRRV